MAIATADDVVTAFEAQAAIRPGALAIGSGDRWTTYAELDRRAQEIAVVLTGRGVRPGAAVGVCVGGAIDRATTLIAILKAGGAYVILTADGDDEQQTAVAADAGIRIAVVDRAVQHRLPVSVTALIVEDIPSTIVAPHAAVSVPAEPHQVASVAYTSTPSNPRGGVLTTHANLTAAAESFGAIVHLTPASRIVTMTHDTDASVIGLWAVLSIGASVYAIDDAQVRDGERLHAMLSRDGTSMLLCSASCCQGLLESQRLTGVAVKVLTRGEPLSKEIIGAAVDHGVELVHLDGHDETTRLSTAQKIGPTYGGRAGHRPTAPSRVHILDATLRPVALNVPGELCVGGPSVANGYSRQPAATAERFVPDPFGAPGSRLYRTGDRGRWRPDGSIEIVAPGHPSTVTDARRPVARRRDRQSTPDSIADVVGAILRHTAARPNAPAIVAGPTVVTYGELGARADAIAATLHALGTQPEERVGVCLTRGPWLATAFVGVLQAGAAYVPLDPAYPRLRLQHMVRDAGIRTLLCEDATRDCVDEAIRFVKLPLEQPAVPPAPTIAIAPRRLAYVIYTSGSTGQPKGVGVEHGGLANLAAAQAVLFGVRPTDRVLLLSSPSFDASVWEMVMALTQGAALHVAELADLSPAGIVRLLEQQAISIATVPPSLVAAQPPPLPAFRTLITAGEPCWRELVNQWKPGRRMFNAYGPTETTVCATAFEFPNDDDGPIRIGTALPNGPVYLLDDDVQKVTDGAVGELCVGGAQVARGYHGRAEATAARFVPDPFAPTPGARMFRTGDLAKRLPSGELVFIGRADAQVKIRGVRIELGEIEHVLRAHPDVADAAVVAHTGADDRRRLVAYVVGRDGQPALGLRMHLEGRLPAAAIPSQFVALDALPLTTSGKIDRTALAIQVPPIERAPSVQRAPRNEIEVVVARLWREVLGADEVGVDEKFFEAGGDSVKLMVLHNLLETEFPGMVQAAELFELNTVEAIAARVAWQRDGEPVSLRQDIKL